MEENVPIVLERDEDAGLEFVWDPNTHCWTIIDMIGQQVVGIPEEFGKIVGERMYRGNKSTEPEETMEQWATRMATEIRALAEPKQEDAQWWINCARRQEAAAKGEDFIEDDPDLHLERFL